jgi:hypothetical protein
VEKALNHTIGGVRGVYNRAEYAEQRKMMLQFWAGYIDGLAPASNLIISHVAAPKSGERFTETATALGPTSAGPQRSSKKPEVPAVDGYRVK